MRTGLTLGVTLLAAFTIAACGGSDGGNGSNPNIVLAKTSTASGDGQTAVVATILPQPLRVVLTADGAPKANATISWTATNGSVNPATSTTDGNGIATTSWTLGTTSGAQSAEAGFTGATGSPQTFTASGTPGTPSGLAKVGGDLQTAAVNAAFALPLQVRVSDAFGNAAIGVPVNWAVTAGSATMDAASSTSNSNGIASVVVTAGNSPGSVTIEATSTALSGRKASFSLTVAGAIRGVTMGDFFFRSSTNNTQDAALDTVKVGGAIRWTSTGGTHSVQSVGSPSFTGSGTISTVGGTYLHVFTTVGTYQYECGIHGSIGPSAMFGTIVVEP